MGVRFQQCRLNEVVAVGILAALSVPAYSQALGQPSSTALGQKSNTNDPQRYQRYAQKLAPFVPSPQRVVDRMLDMAAPKAGETVFDLGCGDGRVLVTAAERYNTKAVGVEVDERLVQRANDRITQAGLADRVKIVQGDLMQADLTGADVVVIYLLTGSNELLRPRLEKFLRPGARVVSYSYKIPGWKPLKVDRTDEQHGHEIYLYEMPPVKQ